MIERIIAGATIVDGRGTPRLRTDLGIVGDRIALIGDLHDREANARTEAAGLLLVPGFIDANASGNAAWRDRPDLRGLLAQGVTTALAGGGDAAAPLAHQLPSGHLPLNLASFARIDETTTLAAARHAVEAGALGLCADLGNADIDPALVREAGAQRLAVELRNSADDLLASLDEAITLAAASDCALHIAHHHSLWKRNRGMLHKSLERIDAARTAGMQITLDVYPYVATWTSLLALARSSHRNEALFLSRLQRPEHRAALAITLEVQRRFTWRNLCLAQTADERNADVLGLAFDELARRRRLSPSRAFVEVLAHDGAQAYAFVFGLDEGDVAAALSAPFTCIGSSAAPVPLHPVGSIPNLVHPRAFGSHARTFGRFVRQRGSLDFDTALARMTSIPATIFNLRDRGAIAIGHYADLVLLEEAAFTDTATYEQPRSLATGIREVICNGVTVVRDGAFLPARPGRALTPGGIA